jgi:hypothetical protein
VSRDDVPVPEEVPRKRRVLEDESVTLDRFLAVWAARPDLTPSDRRRVEDERYRRKRLSPIVCLGVLVGREGMTPAQRQAFAEYREQIKATEVTEPADRGSYAVLQAVVKVSTVLFAAPKEPREPIGRKAGVWAAVRYAKHRGVPVRVVLPTGDIHNG